MKDYYKKQFEFNDWANSAIIDHLLEQTDVPEKTVKLISHIISAQDIWFERVKKNRDYNISPWDEYSLQECKILSPQSTENWLSFIKRTSEKNLEEVCSYFDTKGDYHETGIPDIITHLFNHSMYHRGQINQLLSQAGLKPVSIDYIIYVRQPG